MLSSLDFLTLPHGSLLWNPELVRRWTGAAARSGKPDPFSCTPAWQLAFHDAFYPSRRLLIEEEEGNIMAFAEMALPSGRAIFTPLESHWISGCPLLGPDAEELLAHAVALFARNTHVLPPAFLISGMEMDSPLLMQLYRNLGHFCRFLEQPFSLQRSASLEGGMDGYLSRRSANFRAKMKKARRKALAQGVMMERHVPAEPAEADRLYGRMLAVEEKSWKGLEHCGMAETPSREFYHTMIRRLSLYQGARVMFATHEGKDIGFIFGGMAGPYYRGQQFSYAADWKAFSIGDLLQLEQLLWLCEEGALRYDMGMSDHPSMAYKIHWAEKEQILQACVILPGRG
ncbi:GNAT family N-acetyltransferase [Mailhella massiliensis]|uniref:GNAT family N-acetyltransferase n=1 Tax=Mailhella massiliensis TaxID=1903261 RepID=A0A921AXB2_9BACT|nr:GNAT family N-acetyltransferase [Mailhella massiliensis]HJD98040.1 GNAT family N-acetyltransferase [Mailhella massiliensis]